MLDFAQVVPQIQAFTADQLRVRSQQEAARAEAERRLRAAEPDWPATQTRILQSRTSWLVAELLEPPARIVALPETPSPCVVFAADGSQIVSDRHDIALCYLLNIGLITLRYGTGERPLLASRPTLALPEEELLEVSEGEQVVIAPRRLHMRRLLAELAGLAELIREEGGQAAGYSRIPEEPILHPQPSTLSPDLLNTRTSEHLNTANALALFDGSLILWPLETEEEAFRAEALGALRDTLETARRCRVPIAGYISQPQSRDVINALRVFQCPHPVANCDTYCPNRARPLPRLEVPPCAYAERITDAELFAGLLAPGERSAIFGSRSKILDVPAYSTEQRIRFFYLHTGQEVARVEIPEWVAADPALLRGVHALCYDQARKGDGYPVALAEAHEQAIVRSVEREAFFRLIERAFVTTHQPVAVTQKAVSKRARRV